MASAIDTRRAVRDLLVLLALGVGGILTTIGFVLFLRESSWCWVILIVASVVITPGVLGGALAGTFRRLTPSQKQIEGRLNTYDQPGIIDRRGIIFVCLLWLVLLLPSVAAF